MKYGEKHDLLPVGAKPKGGSVPEYSLQQGKKLYFWLIVRNLAGK
ncbi:hypothetical protein [Vibrio chagasii]|nr:hypothetical protein [Vibrio chagasii]